MGKPYGMNTEKGMYLVWLSGSEKNSTVNVHNYDMFGSR